MAIFDSWGVRHPVTVLQLDECEVVQVREREVDAAAHRSTNRTRTGVFESLFFFHSWVVHVIRPLSHK